MDLLLQDKVAIVTGASRGLGRAIVEEYVREGMHVVAAARSAGDLDELRRQCGEAVVAAPWDARDEGSSSKLVELALTSFGALDVVVNNAGIAPAVPFMDAELDLWREVLAVNLLAPVALTRAAGAVFLEQRHGKVINVASLSGMRGKARLAAYGASKGAMLRFTESLAAEWARHNIQVNAIAPGAFSTEAQHQVLDDEQVLARRLRKIPAGRMGAAEEMGPLACYLASPRSDFVSGAVYVIDGGEYAKL